MDQAEDSPPSGAQAERGPSHVPRVPENCPHREDLNLGEGGVAALDCTSEMLLAEGIPSISKDPRRCRLLAEISGLEEPEATVVSWNACLTCCERFEPSRERINSTIASELYGIMDKVIEKGGQLGCDLEKAKELKIYARENLAWVRGEVEVPDDHKWTGPCFYQGAPLGDGDQGVKEQGVKEGQEMRFCCSHERHEVTTIKECMECRDHDPELTLGEVKTWVVGITTAPRQHATLEQSANSLRDAGWTDGTIFADPGTELEETSLPFPVTTRTQAMGSWPNWFLSLTEMYMLNPHADAYLLCQDDVLYCQGLREYLESELWPDRALGVVSLHTASHQDRGGLGFYRTEFGSAAWGAQAYVFSNCGLRALLRDPAVVNHRQRGRLNGERNVDSVVGRWCKESGWGYFLHSPSLTQHIGDTSTLWRTSTKAIGRRQAATFVGEQYDARRLIGLLQESPENCSDADL